MSLTRCLLAAVALFFVPANTHAAPDAPFTFAQVGGASPGALQKLGTPPAFVVDTGALEETRSGNGVDADTVTVSGQSVAYYRLPAIGDTAAGNIAPRIPATARKRAYRSFDTGGCHFILLDTAAPLTRLGHLPGDELRWLETDLKRTRRGTPIFVFSQHEIGAEPRIVDNEDAVLRLLALHSVVSILCSTDTPRMWTINGITCVGSPPLDRGSYMRVRVDSASVTIERVGDGANAHAVTLPRTGNPVHQVAFLWDDPNVPILERRRFLTELRDATEHAKDEKSRADYRLDGGPSTPMARDARDKESVSFIAEFLTKGLTPGAHTVTLVLTSGDGGTYVRDETFLVERVAGEAKQSWDDPFDAATALQAGPLLIENTVIVAGLDGRVCGLDAATGRQRWKVTMPDAVVATPAALGDAAVAAAADGSVWAIEGRSGHVRWKADAGGPVLAATAVLGDTVACVAGGTLVGFNAATGARKWTANIAGLAPAQPAAGDGAFYVTCRGEAGVVAIDAASGHVRWNATVTTAGAGDPMAGPAFGDRRVYVACADGAIRAFETGAGAPVWVARAPDSGSFAGHTADFATGRVYVSARGPAGLVYALDASSGKIIWHAPAGAELQSAAPATTDRTVAVATAAGELFCFDAATGKMRCRYALEPGWVLGTPALGATTVYAASLNGKAYGIALP